MDVFIPFDTPYLGKYDSENINYLSLRKFELPFDTTYFWQDIFCERWVYLVRSNQLEFFEDAQCTLKTSSTCEIITEIESRDPDHEGRVFVSDVWDGTLFLGYKVRQKIIYNAKNKSINMQILAILPVKKRNNLITTPNFWIKMNDSATIKNWDNIKVNSNWVKETRVWVNDEKLRASDGAISFLNTFLVDIKSISGNK